MGIDAVIVVEVPTKPTENQLTEWSWKLCKAVGPEYFFISDGSDGERNQVRRAIDFTHRRWRDEGDPGLTSSRVKERGCFRCRSGVGIMESGMSGATCSRSVLLQSGSRQTSLAQKSSMAGIPLASALSLGPRRSARSCGSIYTQRKAAARTMRPSTAKDAGRVSYRAIMGRLGS